MRFLSLSILSIFLFVQTAAADQNPQETLSDALSVVNEMLNTPDEHIPKDLFAQAQAIIIFPTMLKGGFMFAVRGGKGVASVRSKETGKWGPPAFLYTTGLSFGLQIGVEAVDLILLVMSQRGMEGLIKDQFTLGGDIAVAVGPVGRHAEAAADILMQGEIYAYSRSKGAFAGLSVKGTVITEDKDANHGYYEEPLSAKEILTGGKVKIYPQTTKRFIEGLNRAVPPRTGSPRKSLP